MKVTLKGTVTKIGEPKEIKGSEGRGTTSIRQVVLQKKSFNHDSGELISDDSFPVQVWEKDMTLFNAAYHVSAKMEIDAYLNGKEYTKKDVAEGEDEQGFFLNLTGKAFRTIK
jgi:hypothetical protein